VNDGGSSAAAWLTCFQDVNSEMNEKWNFRPALHSQAYCLTGEPVFVVPVYYMSWRVGEDPCKRICT